ncbi:carbamoyl-phosphate synthase small subunit [Halothermothrix orenii]|uniref:Carbamoyl-phosphate synthase small chain, CPSase domain protein n=1 Tax=Halothermothrix orenii (strain H 168 / OCM 544 / DSM 9562) TaxID=373903 RepID=B8CWM7_HALOH|nr:carbamoyl-phosphate synthase small subunit [Halothermothrix orenii]ACL69696.1 Carbamoyl-phosphate synthase small chain, CPSase domain protein [Halothermothrix orenii H 168]
MKGKLNLKGRNCIKGTLVGVIGKKVEGRVASVGNIGDFCKKECEGMLMVIRDEWNGRVVKNYHPTEVMVGGVILDKDIKNVRKWEDYLKQHGIMGIYGVDTDSILDDNKETELTGSIELV